MKSVRSRLIIVLILIAGGVYYLFPTYKYDLLTTQEEKLITELSETSQIPLNRLALEVYRNDVDLQGEIEVSNLDEATKQKAIEQLNFLRGDFASEIQHYRPNAIKLGLDLQGGMYLVLEVDILDQLRKGASVEDETLVRILNELETMTNEQDVDIFRTLGAIAARDGVSLNRYWGEAGQSDADILADLEEKAEDAIDRVLEILRNRVDQFGVSEPSISKLGTRRIALELPGVKDPVRARELVGRTALLEFKLLADVDRTSSVLTRLDNAIAGVDTAETDTTATDTLQTAAAETGATDTATELAQDTAAADTGATAAEELFGEDLQSLAESDTVDAEHPLLSLMVGGTSDILVPSQHRSQVMRYLNSREYAKLIPGDVEFLWGSKEINNFGDGKTYWRLYLVKKQSDLNGSKLEDARATIGSGYDPASAGKPIVQMEFTREGGRIFSRVTGANVGKRLAIVLDEKVYMAPNIQDKISGGSAIITGLDDMGEARDIAIVLRAGALPAPVQIVEERTVGPSLGNDSIAAGKTSLTLAFLAVTLFMLLYYRASGGIADIAMILNIFLLLAILGMFQFTLTMPGIAGIILTIGMAVDANVLIFERIREELKLGKTVRAAIDQGFARAVITIIDANITTAIAGIVLLIYGTGAIKGFALTLTIGISVNLFAAIVFTRMVYDMFTARRQINTLSI